MNLDKAFANESTRRMAMKIMKLGIGVCKDRVDND